jgi:fibronectin type 3 domain-containing protein
VAAGGACTIAILFTPSASGTRGASLTITDNASGSPQSASLSGAGTHDVILSWIASPTSGIAGYNLYRGTTPGGESSAPLNSSPINSTVYADVNVTAGAQYYYVVTAVAWSGAQSANSNEVSATIPSP